MWSLSRRTVHEVGQPGQQDRQQDRPEIQIYTESGRILSVEEWELEKLREIYAKDHNAILVNSYVHNLGVYEDWGTRDDLAAGLKWQYKLQHYLVADALT